MFFGLYTVSSTFKDDRVFKCINEVPGNLNTLKYNRTKKGVNQHIYSGAIRKHRVLFN